MGSERRPNRLREAREYLGLSTREVTRHLNWGPALIELVEKGEAPLSEIEWGRLSRLYCRPVAWLKGEPAEPVEISPELDRLMERLSDHDRGEVVRFAQFLAQGKAGGTDEQ